MEINDIVYYNGEACYYKGTWKRDNPNGLAGDVKMRPVRLGPGEFTFTGAPDFTMDEDGNVIEPDR